MSRPLPPVAFLSFLVLIGKTRSCPKINKTCGRTGDGYTYEHGAANLNGPEIQISDNEAVKAHANLKTQEFDYSNDVIHMDNNTVTMRYCQNITVKITILDVNGRVKDHCRDILAIPADATPTPAAETHDVPRTVYIVSAVIVLAFILGMLYWRYTSWKKLHNQGTVLKFLQTLICLREEGTGTDPMADGRTPESINVDHSLSNGRTALPNVDIGVPTYNNAINRSVRDDPGGVNSNKRNNLARGGHDAEHDAEHHETDRLLQSTDIQAPTSECTMNGSLRNDPGVNRNERNNLVRGGLDVGHSAQG